MKAKEYIDKFQADCKDIGRDKAVMAIVTGLLDESDELSKIRKSKTDATMLSILREQDMKYRSICNKEPSLNKEGFKTLLLEQLKINI